MKLYILYLHPPQSSVISCCVFASSGTREANLISFSISSIASVAIFAKLELSSKKEASKYSSTHNGKTALK